MFSASELSVFLRHHISHEIVDALPLAENTSRNEYAAKVAQSLLDRGLLKPPLFAALREARQERFKEIQALESAMVDSAELRELPSVSARTKTFMRPPRMLRGSAGVPPPQLLYQGQSSEVFQTVSRDTGEPCVIKSTREELVSPSALERLVQLHHPNLITPHRLWWEGGRVY